MNSSPVPVRIRISFSGSAPTTLTICPRARWFGTLSWTGPPTVCAATSSTPSSRRLIVKKSLKNSLYSSNLGVGRNSCNDMTVVYLSLTGEGWNTKLTTMSGCLHRRVFALGGLGGLHVRGLAFPAQQLPRGVDDVLGAEPILPEEVRGRAGPLGEGVT